MKGLLDIYRGEGRGARNVTGGRTRRGNTFCQGAFTWGSVPTNPEEIHDFATKEGSKRRYYSD